MKRIRPEHCPTLLTPESEQTKIEIGSPREPRFRKVKTFGTLMSVGTRLVVTQYLKKSSPEKAGRLVRKTAERLGGLWTKVAQILSLRFDRFPRDFCLELMKVQDRTEGFSPEMARQIIEEDFGQPVEATFSDFESHPFAAASIGQVHRATLRNPLGQKVAVKVQRPGIDEVFDADLRILKSLIWWIERIPTLRYWRLKEAVSEVELIAEEELDYRREADSIRRMRKQLREHDVYVPKTWSRYNTSRVLTMEFVGGVLASEVISVRGSNRLRVDSWLDKNNINLKKVAQDLFISFQRQRLDEPRFHGDLHAGNIVLLRDSRIALIDFGTIGRLYPQDQRKVNRYFQAILNRQYKLAAERMLLFFEPFPPIDLNGFRRDWVRVLRQYMGDSEVRGLSQDERLGLGLFSMYAVLGRRHDVPTNWAWLQMSRAEYTMMAVVQNFDDDFETETALRAYFEATTRRAVRKIASPLWQARMGRSVLSQAVQIPLQLDVWVHEAGTAMERNALRFQATSSKLAQGFEGIVGLFVPVFELFGVFLLLVFLVQRVPVVGDWVPEGQWAEILKSFPEFSSPDWALVAAVYIFFLRMLFQMRSSLSTHDSAR